MVSTFTTRKRLEKQTPGENSNTWGSILNSNMIDLIDECFGLVCVAMTTAGDSTLSTNSGASDEGRNSQIVLTGAPTSNVSLFVPAVESFYFVRNKMTGSNKVTLKNNGGTIGVDFSGSGSGAEQGIVISDGTNVREVFRTVSAAGFSSFTSAVMAVVSNATTDTTGGAVADFIPFLDASETGALNKVTVQKLLDNMYLNVTAKTSVGTTDGVFLYNADAAAMQSTTFLNLFKGVQSASSKSVLVSADTVLVLDSAATNTPKKATLTTLGHDLIRMFSATQAIQELGTDTSVAVTPGVQHYHPSAAKCWAFVSGAPGTVPQLVTSYNIDSIADTSLGHITFTIGTDFSSASWAALFTGQLDYNAGAGSEVCAVDDGGMAAGTVRSRNRTTGQSTEGGFADARSVALAGFGDQ